MRIYPVISNLPDFGIHEVWFEVREQGSDSGYERVHVEYTLVLQDGVLHIHELHWPVGDKPARLQSIRQAGEWVINDSYWQRKQLEAGKA